LKRTWKRLGVPIDTIHFKGKDNFVNQTMSNNSSTLVLYVPFQLYGSDKSVCCRECGVNDMYVFRTFRTCPTSTSPPTHVTRMHMSYTRPHVRINVVSPYLNGEGRMIISYHHLYDRWPHPDFYELRCHHQDFRKLLCLSQHGMSLTLLTTACFSGLHDASCIVKCGREVF
jgi:hypothetical protein